jgi:hypothetical protein
MCAAQNHILDLAPVELRHTCERTFDGGRGQIVRTRVHQASSSRFADRSTDGAYDHCFLHDD